MASEDDGKNAATPLDAERAKLKAAGYTDAEVSQILVSKALSGSPQGSSASPQGVMSNALSSIVAIAGHARILLPTFRQDFANIFDRNVRAPTRAGSALALTLKSAVILILAYAGWQEWQQHIVSATAIADSEVKKRHAEECSARMKMIVGTVDMNKWGPAMALYEKDCDPAYAARAKRCEPQFKIVLEHSALLHSSDEATQKRYLQELKDYKEECDLTDEQTAQLREKFSAPPVVSTDDKKKSIEISLKITEKLDFFTTLRKDMQFAMEKGDIDYAYTLSRSVAGYYSAIKGMSEANEKSDWTGGLKSAEALKAIVERPGVIDADKKADQLEMALVSIAWDSLMLRDFKKALDASQQAVTLQPNDLVPKTNLAHALMFLGRVDDAKAIYFAHISESLQGKTWSAVIQDDFGKLATAGVTTPAMADIASMLHFPSPLKPR